MIELKGSKTGGFYRCNIYREMKLKGEISKNSEKSKSNTSKYLFYYMRYQNHEQSLKFTQKNLNELENKISVLWKSSEESNWSDFEYLREALLVTLEALHFLNFFLDF